MKIRVDRTSTLFSEQKPCDYAESVVHKVYIPNRLGDDKYDDQDAHYINIDTLDELLRFVDKHGQIVIYPNNLKEYDGVDYEIEIYDKWRE